MKKLRIATMVTGHFTTPPPPGVVYAPMDIAVGVAEGLVARGHSVDFYAPRGSELSGARIASDGLVPLKQDGDVLKGPAVGGAEQAKLFNLWDQYLLAKMFKAAEEGAYDLLYVHPADRALPLALSHPDVQTVYTLHDPIYPWRAEVFRMFKSPNQHFVSISDSQRKPAPDLNYAATVYNGIDLDVFPFSADHDDYLLFVGRLNPQKGVAEAVEAARKTGEKLLIVGPPVTGEYWEKRIAPYLNERIKYEGHVPREKLAQYYQRAKAVLVPIMWEEPFGLVMTEAMASGAPVIAFRRGSVPEVVVDGKTGFIVDTVEEMAGAIKKINSIDRRACRARVEAKFGIKQMVDGYEEVFLRLASRRQG